jgi:hypothetical protein
MSNKKGIILHSGIEDRVKFSFPITIHISGIEKHEAYIWSETGEGAPHKEIELIFNSASIELAIRKAIREHFAEKYPRYKLESGSKRMIGFPLRLIKL